MARTQLYKHDLEVVGTVSASNFIGDASGLTGITSSAEWDGTLTGDANINGSLIVSGAGEEADFQGLDIVRGDFSGSFTGSGASLVDLNLNGYTIDNLTSTGSFSGSFKGDGSQLTGILNFPYQGDATVTGSLIVTGSQIDFSNTGAITGSIFTGSFIGDGAGLTGITSTWNGIRSGSSEITGSLTLTEDLIVRDELKLTNLNTTSSLALSTINFTTQQIDNSIIIGYQAGDKLTNATDNIYLGYQAGFNAENTIGDIAIGYQTLLNNTGFDIGDTYNLSYNTAIGYQALVNNTAGYYNTAIGKDSLRSNTVGRSNIAIGYKASENLEQGDFNISIGVEAGRDNIDESNNTLVGYFAGRKANSDNNTAFGFRALEGDINTGDNNTAVGHQAGRFLDGGEGNIFIGHNAGPSTLTTLNNKLYISNKFGTPLIEGDFSNNTVHIDGNISANNFSGSFTGDGSGLANVAGAGFPFQGQAEITGSLIVSESQDYNPAVTVENGIVVLSQVSQSLEFADDTEAAAAGIPLGGLYRSGNYILIRIT